MTIDQEAPNTAVTDPPEAGPSDPGRNGGNARSQPYLERFDRSLDWLAVNWPHLVVAFGVFGYFLYYRHLTIEIHDGYGTSAFDIGVFDQGIWLLSRFKNPFVTITGRNLFA